MPPPNPAEEPIDESWMATFADMDTLLMAFFVMLLNFFCSVVSKSATKQYGCGSLGLPRW